MTDQDQKNTDPIVDGAPKDIAPKQEKTLSETPSVPATGDAGTGMPEDLPETPENVGQTPTAATDESSADTGEPGQMAVETEEPVSEGEESEDDTVESDKDTEEKDTEGQEEPKKSIDEIVGNPDESEREMDYVPITDAEFQAKTKEIVLPTMLKFFHPELLNRFDDIIFFSPLREEDLAKIVELMLHEPREMLGEKNILIKISDAAKDFLAKKGYNPAFGARPLRRAIQQYVEDPLADSLILQEFVSGDTIFIDLHEDETKLTFQKDIPDEDESKVIDPFAVLDQEAEDGTDETKQDPDQDKGGEETESDRSEADRTANTEAGQPQDENETTKTDEQTDESEETPKKKSFFEKLFVKAKTDHPEADDNEKEDEPKNQEQSNEQKKEPGIRFVDGKIVED